MSSATYQVFEQAMRARSRVVCFYNGHRRELCPIVLGHTRGEEKALTFQVGGSSGSGLPPGGEWRCLFLAKVRHAALHDGPWIVPDGSHTWPQGCVADVDLDVNPASPFSPKRKL
jgi:hypothetical protein